MKSKIIGAVLVLGLIGIMVSSLLWERRMVAGLPPQDPEYPNASAAWIAALSYAAQTGGKVGTILGTGSMAPYIPAAPENPQRTIVAYWVNVSGAHYTDVKQGDLITYTPQWPLPDSLRHALVMHQAAQKDSGGWIMSGLNNKYYENMHRVDALNFRGIVAKTFIWKLE